MLVVVYFLFGDLVLERRGYLFHENWKLAKLGLMLFDGLIGDFFPVAESDDVEAGEQIVPVV